MAASMSRGSTPILLALLLSPGVGWGQCVFDQFNEITNPFAATCGGLMFTYTESNNVGQNIALGYPPPMPVASLTAVDGFRDYASLFAQHQMLLTDNADAVSGTIVGQTLSGRDIWGYRIGDTSDNTTVDGQTEPAVMLNGGTHAREWQSPEGATELFETLVERKADGSVGQFLFENLNVVLLPVLNIDGFLQTQAFPTSVTADPGQPRDGRMRRKNLRDPVSQSTIDGSLATTGDNFWGVDLNRNSQTGFGLNGGSWGQGRETSLIYRSVSAASEPEIMALQSATALAPANRLRMYTDLHSFSQIYFTPLTGNATRDTITIDLMTRMRLASPRGYRDGRDSAAATGQLGIGTTSDYFAYTFQIPSWTLETEPLNGGQDYGGTATHGHSGFILPDSQIARMRDDITGMLWLGFYRQAALPRVQAIQISDVNTGTVVYEASWGNPAGNNRTLNVSTNSALVPGGNYRLWLAFNKPMRWRDGGGNVARYQGQNVDGNTGDVRIEIPSLGAAQDIVVPASTASVWLNQPGGAPAGYLRYADDALVANFTVPAGIGVAAPTPAVLSVSNQDFSQSSLDANPATAVDWAGGQWQRYENSLLANGTTGGTDCAIQLYVSPLNTDPAPATTAVCAAAIAPPPPPPPAPPPPSGGGGGSTSWALLLLGLFALARRKRQT